MSESELPKIDDLVAPIGDSSPTGVNVRNSQALDEIFRRTKECRNSSREIERRKWVLGEESNDPTSWDEVVRLGYELLRHSKDLEVAIWICEAFVRTNGFNGLRCGLQLIRRLCENYWERLHPELDEDDLECLSPDEQIQERVRSLTWLFQMGLTSAIRHVPIAKNAATFSHLIQVQQALIDGSPMDDVYKRFDAGFEETPTECFHELRSRLNECLDEFLSLHRELQKKCGRDRDGNDLAPPRDPLVFHITAFAKAVEELELRKTSGHPHAWKTISRIVTTRFQYDWVVPGLGLSGSPRLKEDIEHTEFGAIVNLCDYEPPRYADGLADVEIVRIPFEDGHPAPFVSLLLAVLELARLQNSKTPTLVHCLAGISRSPTVVGLYLMALDDLTWEQAIRRIAIRRNVVSPYPNLTTESVRREVVNAVRNYLRGDLEILKTARHRYQKNT